LVRSNISDWAKGNEHLEPGAYEARMQFPERLLTGGKYSLSLTVRRSNGSDLLLGHVIERSISISNPIDLNIEGVNDPSRAKILLNKVWELRRI
jgi:hypothetical protein